jgi:hypothetical protein
MNNPLLTIEVTPTLQDLRWVYFYALKGKLPMVVGALCVFIVVMTHKDFMYSPDSTTLLGYIVRLLLDFLPIPLLLVIFSLATRFQLNFQWKKTPELREKKRYDISDTEIRISSESFTSTFGWEKIIRAVFTKERVILVNTLKHFYIFPMAALPHETLEVFTATIKSHVNNVKFA